jgi:hypothetical protein
MTRECGAPSIRKRPFSIETSVITGSSAFADDDNGEATDYGWVVPSGMVVSLKIAPSSIAS